MSHSRHSLCTTCMLNIIQQYVRHFGATYTQQVWYTSFVIVILLVISLIYDSACIEMNMQNMTCNVSSLSLVLYLISFIKKRFVNCPSRHAKLFIPFRFYDISQYRTDFLLSFYEFHRLVKVCSVVHRGSKLENECNQSTVPCSK